MKGEDIRLTASSGQGSHVPNGTQIRLLSLLLPAEPEPVVGGCPEADVRNEMNTMLWNFFPLLVMRAQKV